MTWNIFNPHSLQILLAKRCVIVLRYTVWSGNNSTFFHLRALFYQARYNCRKHAFFFGYTCIQIKNGKNIPLTVASNIFGGNIRWFFEIFSEDGTCIPPSFTWNVFFGTRWASPLISTFSPLFLHLYQLFLLFSLLLYNFSSLFINYQTAV